MKARSAVLALAVTLLTGCASSLPLFQAAWFLAAPDLVDTPASKVNSAPKSDAALKTDTLYIGLLNQSARRLTAIEIILNAPEGEALTGWHLTGPIPLEPGEMLVRPANNFTRDGKGFPAACHLPVKIAVVLTPDGNITPAEIYGRMPNFLPAYWERDCAK